MRAAESVRRPFLRGSASDEGRVFRLGPDALGPSLHVQAVLLALRLIGSSERRRAPVPAMDALFPPEPQALRRALPLALKRMSGSVLVTSSPSRPSSRMSDGEKKTRKQRSDCQASHGVDNE